MLNQIIGKKMNSLGLKKHLMKLAIAHQDMQTALATCDFILSNQSKIEGRLLDSLKTAIIICYARPFTDNEQLGALSSGYAKFENKKYEQIHKSLIEARCKTYAHSDLSARNVIIHPPNSENEYFSISVGFLELANLMIKDVKDIIIDLDKRITKDIFEVMKKLFSIDGIPKHPTELKI
jgi:hypothetical protein